VDDKIVHRTTGWAAGRAIADSLRQAKPGVFEPEPTADDYTHKNKDYKLIP